MKCVSPLAKANHVLTFAARPKKTDTRPRRSLSEWLAAFLEADAVYQARQAAAAEGAEADDWDPYELNGDLRGAADQAGGMAAAAGGQQPAGQPGNGPGNGGAGGRAAGANNNNEIPLLAPLDFSFEDGILEFWILVVLASTLAALLLWRMVERDRAARRRATATTATAATTAATTAGTTVEQGREQVRDQIRAPVQVHLHTPSPPPEGPLDSGQARRAADDDDDNGNGNGNGNDNDDGDDGAEFFVDRADQQGRENAAASASASISAPGAASPSASASASAATAATAASGPGPGPGPVVAEEEARDQRGRPPVRLGEDQGFFPPAGDAEFAQWAAGGVGH